MKLLLVALALVLPLVLACTFSNDLSDDDIATLVDEMVSHPKYQEASRWSDEEIWALAEAQAAQGLIEWSDEEIWTLAEAQAAIDPITPREDCAQTLLLAAYYTADAGLPQPDIDTDALCDWYEETVEGG